MQTTDTPLPRSVIVTRPAHQASGFAARIAALDLKPILFPTIDIQLRKTTLKVTESSVLINSGLWIFTSTNAVAGAIQCGVFRYRQQHKVACIGSATNAALQQAGIAPDFVPDISGTSENLIAYLEQAGMPEGAVTIVRGDGGRDLLKTSLQNSGHRVDYLDVYRRALPVVDADVLQQTIAALPCMISVTSNQGLDNLLQLIPENAHAQLFASRLIVNSERGAITARTCGFNNTIEVAQPPGDSGQLATLEKLFTKNM